jgi:hypothetical protein
VFFVWFKKRDQSQNFNVISSKGMFLAVCVCAAAGAAGNPKSWLQVGPTPPAQTTFQKQLIAKIDVAAATASAAATPAVVAYLSTPDFVAGINRCCKKKLGGKSGEELLAILTAEIRVAELTHNFHAVNLKTSWENDISVGAGLRQYFVQSSDFLDVC